MQLVPLELLAPKDSRASRDTQVQLATRVLVDHRVHLASRVLLDHQEPRGSLDPRVTKVSKDLLVELDQLDRMDNLEHRDHKG